MRFRRHAIALLTFAAITGLWLLPLFSRLNTALPGTNAGDNVTFVWNLWWMRYALHHADASFLTTAFLFHPFGADLTLHTHTLLPALAAAMFPATSVIAAQNLLITAHLYLNFVCSYALAYRTTGRSIPAAIGAVIFGTSTFVSAHLLGHFNLIAGWIVPLVCLLAWRAAASRSYPSAALAGVAVAAAAYIDYYLFVYSVLLIVLCGACQLIRITPSPPVPSRAAQRVSAVLIALLLLDGLIIAAILLWSGDRIDVGPFRISIRSVRNPITAAWILAALAGVVNIWRRVRFALDPAPLRSAAVLAIVGAGTALVLLLPLLIRAAELWRSGRYVSQSYQWRSAPGGIDVATVMLGNPFHLLWGEPVRRVHAALGIDTVESSAWVPLAALMLAGIATFVQRREAVVRASAIGGAAFLIWALGPWLMAFGRQTPILLPAFLVRYVPIVANARIPGRAMIVVYLAVSMLGAVGAAWLLAQKGRARTLAWGLTVLLLIECAPARPPLYAPAIAPQYARLKSGADRGAVCELPLGIRDGFGETGRFDSMVLLHQTVHERPIVGGFVARLAPDVRTRYEAMPVIGSLLRLSAGGRLSDQPTEGTPAEASARLASAGVGFVVLDTRVASADLIRYVQTRLALRVLVEADGRVFYQVF
jgi:hypothetical protein